MRANAPEAGAVCGEAARTDLGGGRATKRTSLPLPRRQLIVRFKRANAELCDLFDQLVSGCQARMGRTAPAYTRLGADHHPLGSRPP
jgi:hypothetical protein